MFAVCDGRMLQFVVLLTACAPIVFDLLAQFPQSVFRVSEYLGDKQNLFLDLAVRLETHVCSRGHVHT